MITFFRRIFTSPIGAAVALVFLVMLGFAFTLSDVTGSIGSGAVTGGNLARVGDRQISAVELRQRIQRTYQAAAQQSPGSDYATVFTRRRG